MERVTCRRRRAPGPDRGVPPHPSEAVFGATFTGWRRRQLSRHPATTTITARLGPVRRFAGHHDEPGLPEILHPHSLRHSYIAHLIRDGSDSRFVQQRVGHARVSTTATYTHTGSPFMDHARPLLRRPWRPLGLAPGPAEQWAQIVGGKGARYSPSIHQSSTGGSRKR
ncbi:tyrosine-type recombinase/integrase [Nocardiopsis deserti]|uniref:tyrosine-type recombinase/integrase n=1 Tax=Nocardiopsis deserti TaxID=2605988 RepID=UPI001CC2576F|nr:tyrosine-type recombinase/integrase [Nocardiopsis deserti]